MYTTGNNSNYYVLTGTSHPRAIQTILRCPSRFRNCFRSGASSRLSHLTAACARLGMALVTMYYLQEAITKPSIPFPFSPVSSKLLLHSPGINLFWHLTPHCRSGGTGACVWVTVTCVL